MMQTRASLALLALLTMVGCGAEAEGPGTTSDAGVDAPVDGAVDGSIDAGTDPAPDAGTDAAADGSGADVGPDASPDAAPDATPAGCGDGVRAGAEECDEGAANSATAPDACRPDCREARCGDGVVDTGEACDDGDGLGGDGCSPTCAVEAGPFEAEPNDTLPTANPVASGTAVTGSLPAGDVDCFRIDVAEPGWVRAVVAGGEACAGDTALGLFGPTGTSLVGNDDAGPGERCSAIDPAVDAGARYLVAGEYVVCVSGFLRAEVPVYQLTLETDDDACEPGRFPVGGGSDIDGDTIPDACDDDDDDDGEPDATDNCPQVSNAGRAIAVAPPTDGSFREWLVAGPYQYPAAGECLPGEQDPFEGSGVSPEVGTFAGRQSAAPDAIGLRWQAAVERDAHLNFNEVFSSPAPHAAYALVYVRSPDARAAQLRLGSDDGVRVWVNDVEVFERGTCRGASADQDRVDIELEPGLNRVRFMVQDGGGGWGLYGRIVDAAGAAMPDLVYSRSRDADAVDDQNDADGDGVGDACDLR
jgi:cysteine-rich repeat protein